MKLPLAYYGHPILRKKGALIEAITPEIHQLIEDMKDTMIACRGVGLAAPQVHHSLALFIAYFDRSDQAVDRQNIQVFINPKILHYSKNLTTLSEGCLSIPKIYRDIDRPQKVTLSALNEKGESFTQEFAGYDAHVVLHENDHVNGVLFIDRLPIKERRALESRLREMKKASR